MRVIAIMPGRFQPFHASHYAVYKYLASKFGANNVYIVTSNKVQAKSPFNFKEKVLIMNRLFGIPASQILNSTTPYRVESLYSKFNKDNTVLVYASTEKDPRLSPGKYFKGSLPKNPKPYSQQAYTIPVPYMSNKFEGTEISGTTVRNLFSSSKLSLQQKKKAFKLIFGKYDQTVFNLMISKVGANLKQQLIREGIHDKANFKCVFMAGTPAAGKSTTCQDLFKTQYNISSYGLRVVNPDYPFVKYLQKDNLPPEFQTIGKQKWDSTKQRAVRVFEEQFKMFVQARKGIIIDRTCGKFSDLAQRKAMVEKNGYDTMMVFVTTPLQLALYRNSQRDRHVGEETVIEVYNSVNRYKDAYKSIFGNNFVEVNTQKGGSVDSKIRSKIVSFINQPVKNPIALQWIVAQKKLRNITKESLLKEGGASGHMTHIFQDTQLTFNDFRAIINNLLSGKINLESQATMKYDGQNINVSWKNGKLVAARNKGHQKNFGETAPDVLGIKNMFAGRGAIQEAFTFAMIDLQRAFSAMSKKQLDQIFGQGKRWLALEIIYPKTANVIPYDKSMLVFHNVTQVDQSGNKVKVDGSMAKSVYSIIVSVNANVQKHFAINPPTVVRLPKISNFAARKGYYLSKLANLQQRFKLSGKSTLQDYNDAYWETLINMKASSMKYDIPKPLMDALITRWSRLDKTASINILKTLCDNPEFLNWIRSFDKNDHFSTLKKNAYDWETLFMELTSQVLKNLGEFMVVNPDNAIKKLSNDLLATSEQIKGTNNLALIGKATALMNRINALGGTKTIVPTEGIVFTYKGNIYKATGLFGDINQILGALKYAR